MIRLNINHPGTDILSKAVAQDLEKRSEIADAIAGLGVEDSVEIFGFPTKESLRKYVGIRLLLNEDLNHDYEHKTDDKKLTYTIRRVG